MKRSLDKFPPFLGMILFIIHMSCGQNPISSVPTTGSIKISLKPVTNATSSSVNKVSGNASTVVTITSARVVIDEIELENIEDDSLDYEFEEPFVQDLVGSSNLYEIGTIQVPFGSYKELEIEIDDLKAEDGAVYTQNPELQDLSIRVEGYLNGDSTDTFVFTSDLSEEQEREFNPPLVLDENSASINLVLTINMDTWFVDSSGNFLDPRIESSYAKIEDNIEASLEVFEDKDDDGEEDEDD